MIKAEKPCPACGRRTVTPLMLDGNHVRKCCPRADKGPATVVYVTADGESTPAQAALASRVRVEARRMVDAWLRGTADGTAAVLSAYARPCGPADGFALAVFMHELAQASQGDQNEFLATLVVGLAS